MARLEGRVALVTGSSRGIGLGIARRLLEEGAAVVLNSENGRELSCARDQLAALGADRLMAVTADVSDAVAVSHLFSEVDDHFGRVDILVNNAGLANPVSHLLATSPEHWQTVLRTNLTSVFLCTREAALRLQETGGGVIVNISSFGAQRAHRSLSAYDATKGGIEAFTRAAALDLAPIRVNAVGPGPIDNGSPVDAEQARRRAAMVPLGRLGTPADVAAAVAFLASDDASFITGQILYVDGGMLAQLRPPTLDTSHPDPAASGTRIDGQEE